MGNYVVISADGHAGPPAEVYRDYLDPEFRERFDEHQRRWASCGGVMGATTAASELSGRRRPAATAGSPPPSTPTPATPSSTSRAWPAEVLFPDADVLGTGRIAASPFGTGLAGDNSERRRRPWPAAAPTTDGWPTSWPRSPIRRIGVAVIPAIIPDMDTVLDHRPRGQGPGPLAASSSRPGGSTDRRTTTPLRTAVGADRGARPRAAHPLRRRAHRHRPGPGHAADLRLRGRVVGRPPPGRADLGRHLRAPPRPALLDGRERCLVGARPDPQDGREVGRRPQHPQVRRCLPPGPVDEAERVPRPQLLLRRVDAGRGRHRASPPDRGRAT